MGQYLSKIGNSFYFRRRIPRHLSHFFQNKAEFRICLGKISQLRANMISKNINELFKELIMLLQNDTNNKNELVFRYTNQMYCYSNKKNKTYTVQSGYSLTDLQEQKEKLNKELHEKIDTLSFKEKRKLLEDLGLFEKLIHIIDPKNDFTQKQQTTTPKKANITLKKLYEIFLKEKRAQSDDDIADSTWRDYQSSYNDFIYVHPDAENKDISEFTREDFRVFVDALHNHLPKSRTKLAKFKTLPYSKLKERELTEDEKLAFDTKKKKISTIKQMFDIAIDERYGYIEKNYAEAFVLKPNKKTKKSVKPRHPLKPENLQKLFSSKIYTTKKEQILKYKPEQYWIPIIALYTGMRENEICQLYVEDVQSEVISTGKTVYYFDVNDDKDKHIKNQNARRKVPLHPKLIELGFMEYYNSIKNKQERLWSNLRLHPTEKRYATDYSKNFMKYFRKHVTIEKDQVFHSFRHSVGDQLLKNAVKHRLPKALMNQILGHAPDKDETTQTYSQGYGIEELYTGVCSLEFEAIF